MVPGKTHWKQFYRNSCPPVICKNIGYIQSRIQGVFNSRQISQKSCEGGNWCQQHAWLLYPPKSMPAPGMAVKAGTMCTRPPDEEALCARSSCSWMQTGMLSMSSWATGQELSRVTVALGHTLYCAYWETRRKMEEVRGRRKQRTVIQGTYWEDWCIRFKVCSPIYSRVNKETVPIWSGN